MKHKILDLLKYLFYQFQKVSVAKQLFVLAVIAVIPWFIIFSFPDNVLHVYFFDIGQGDSMFIKTPHNYQILIDGGPSKAVLAELGKVMPFYDRTIDLVLLTHPHMDHVTGLIEVLQRFEVGQVLVNEAVDNSTEYKIFLETIEQRKILRQNFLQDDKIVLGDGVELMSFWPLTQTSIFDVLDVNRVSQVVRLDYGNFSVLFTGDAELGLENPQLAYLDWEQVDVLKVPHHGSKDAIAEKALQKLKPFLAIISVGLNNFGHPSEEVLNLLIKQGIKILRTDEEGMIEVVSDGEGWEVVNY